MDLAIIYSMSLEVNHDLQGHVFKISDRDAECMIISQPGLLASKLPTVERSSAHNGRVSADP